MTRYSLAFFCLLLAGCASNPSIRDVGQLPLVENRALPAPYADDPITGTRPYYIGPLDVLSIDVFGIEGLAVDEIQADSSGRIAFPFAGVVEAVGLTPGQLAAEIEGRLRGRYVLDPKVTVNVKEIKSRVVTIEGQVTEPGLYPVVGNMTLLRALASAKGTSEFAKLEEVIIFRTVEGQRMAGVYNLAAIRAGAYEDPSIYADDLVVVGDSPARRRFETLLQAAPLITTPLLILFNNNN